MSPSTSTSERRQAERRRANWPIEGQVKGSRAFSSVTVDVSATGFLMICARALTVGTHAYVFLDTYANATKRKIGALVVIRHCSIKNQHFHCGVEFVKIAQEDQLYIARYVNQTRKQTLGELVA